ncbi:MAG TPA: cache domain-containing protein [Stellaceae bacterium]|nr:cache domain-containing protein [Stellaceae bacterium]
MLAISALSLAATIALGGSLLHQKIFAAREQQAKQLVEVALHIVEDWYDSEQSGRMTRAQAQASAIAMLRTLRYGNNEYFWINRFDGVTVLHSNQPNLEGKFRLGATDPDGVAQVRIQIEEAKANGGFVYYRFPRIGSLKPVRKVAYAAGFAPWEWAIGTGAYVDDIDTEFRSALIELILIASGIFAVATLCGYLVSQNIGFSLASLKTKMERLAGGELTVDISEAERADEIGDMGRAMRVFKDNAIAKRELEMAMNHAGRIDALGRLAGGIAHDLNNALVPVLAMTKTVLSRMAKDNRERAKLDLVLTGAQRSKDLVQQILAFCRKEAIEKREFDLAKVVDDGVKMLRASLPSTIKIVGLVDRVPPIFGDPGQLNQVLINLATNAAHAIGERVGTITIRLGAEGDARLRLTVADDGCGMNEKTKSRIFEAFFTTKELGKGTGLGLSLVHGIVTSHDGTISVDSTPGEGTRFDIVLPTAAETKRRSAAAVEYDGEMRLASSA